MRRISKRVWLPMIMALVNIVVDARFLLVPPGMEALINARPTQPALHFTFARLKCHSCVKNRVRRKILFVFLNKVQYFGTWYFLQLRPSFTPESPSCTPLCKHKFPGPTVSVGAITCSPDTPHLQESYLTCNSSDWPSASPFWNPFEFRVP